MEESNVVKVGDITNPNAKQIRVVHISDTHLLHDTYLPHIPDGDILIHSGDFGKFGFRKFFTGVNHQHLLDKLDQFFQSLPHRHKIFVAGNHETSFNNKSREEIQSALQHVHYLQDSSITCVGLNIYGSPWNSQRPLLHLYGHVHESSGVAVINGVTFSNAALPFYRKANVFDVFLSKDS
ncbi:hypothetical protein KUTeg_017637 [Tegillarca granosa]|uniref:Calcineurin-like phosphoesterase domain-containing protein n=1 Tax=Tegillarca granosa TaxID=220873 RepID=A0ABQ9EFH1_TEGGR|nr:hypothetical protein KUTeg_017637 [Tegillarca granosa]